MTRQPRTCKNVALRRGDNDLAMNRAMAHDVLLSSQLCPMKVKHCPNFNPISPYGDNDKVYIFIKKESKLTQNSRNKRQKEMHHMILIDPNIIYIQLLLLLCIYLIQGLHPVRVGLIQ